MTCLCRADSARSRADPDRRARRRCSRASPPATAMFRAEPVGLDLTALIADPGAAVGCGLGAARRCPRPGRAARGPARRRRAVRARRERARARGRRAAVRPARARPPGHALRSTPPSTMRRSAWRCSTPTASTCASTRRCASCSAARPRASWSACATRCYTHPEDRQTDVDAAWRVLRGELSSLQCEKRYVRPDGSIVWISANLTFLRDEYGRPLCWVGQFQDITELRRLASRDPLTDTLNRRAFDVELERPPAPRRAAGDRPRRLQGHQRRPRPPRRRRAAARVAGAISRRLRRGDLLGRLGGDEFAVLLPRCDDARGRAAWPPS